MINEFDFPVTISIFALILYRFDIVSEGTCAKLIFFMIILFLIVCVKEF